MNDHGLDYDLDKIIGAKNKELVFNIQMALQNKKIFHGYIIHGERNSGKLFITNCIAKLILCENGHKNNIACNKCYSCRAFDNKNNPDIIYIKPSKTNYIGVDDIREQIKNQVNIRPYTCNYKIFILEDADKMSTAAQNALLKILEEPPSFVIFFLLGENKNNFLPTIISRCVVLKTTPVSISQIEDYLIKNLAIENDLARICAVYSQGNIGRAMILANNNNFILLRDRIISFIRSLKNISAAEAINFVKYLDDQKENINTILDIIYLWYADLILYSSTQSVSYITNLDKIDRIKEDAFIYKNDLLSKIKTIERTKKYLESNTNFKLTMTVMLLELNN